MALVITCFSFTFNNIWILQGITTFLAEKHNSQQTVWSNFLFNHQHWTYNICTPNIYSYSFLSTCVWTSPYIPFWNVPKLRFLWKIKPIILLLTFSLCHWKLWILVLKYELNIRIEFGCGLAVIEFKFEDKFYNVISCRPTRCVRIYKYYVIGVIYKK